MNIELVHDPAWVRGTSVCNSRSDPPHTGKVASRSEGAESLSVNPTFRRSTGTITACNWSMVVEQGVRRVRFIIGTVALLSVGAKLVFISVPGRHARDAIRSLGRTKPGSLPAVRPIGATCVYPDSRILIIENRLEPIKVAKPKYPEDAKRLKIEGLVKVMTLVDQNGSVVWACGKGDPASSGSAEEAAREHKFPKNFGNPGPSLVGRTPVVLNFDFRLHESNRTSPTITQIVRNCDFARYRPLRISSDWLWHGGIAKRVEPEYPPEAMRRRLRGRISVRVLINGDGKVEQVCGNGHPILRDAAEGAALHWVFRPPKLNGEKVPYIQETLQFNFVLDESPQVAAHE